jgi:xanthine dehydrogenase YagS FAD-binding subunit
VSGAPFRYARAPTAETACVEGMKPGAMFVAGGTDLLQLWKAGVLSPEQVVDISRLPLADVNYADDFLSLGAVARLDDVARHPDVARHHPLLAEAILASASGQVRNLATVGGNLLQRTRCPYFRGAGPVCNKLNPGSGCAAMEGENRHAGLFGAGGTCVATHASDLAVALAALDAEVVIRANGSERRLTLDALYPLPADGSAPDSRLEAGALITRVEIAGAARFAPRSVYLKVRDRASFEFAVVSVAAALRMENATIVEARLAAGGVAHRPWRLRQSESALVGAPPTSESFATAAAHAVADARPLDGNAFKIPLLRNAVMRALETAGGAA